MPFWVASIGRNDCEAAMAMSSSRSPGATATARSMSVMGVVPPVLARTLNPPPKVSSCRMAFMNEPFEATPVTSVKTTSVNMARVVPVRKRLASG